MHSCVQPGCARPAPSSPIARRQEEELGDCRKGAGKALFRRTVPCLHTSCAEGKSLGPAAGLTTFENPCLIFDFQRSDKGPQPEYGQDTIFVYL